MYFLVFGGAAIGLLAVIDFCKNYEPTQAQKERASRPIVVSFEEEPEEEEDDDSGYCSSCGTNHNSTECPRCGA